jgi:two-component system nitrogen regulation response regulator NtrX
LAPRILIVDDEDSIRVALQRLLEYNGYETRQAEDGFRALEILADETVDVVLLDIKMPRMDGLEVLQRVRERADGPFVVMVTAHGDTQTAVECMKRGADDYLEKPWEQERLLAIIRGGLRQRQQAREISELRRTHPSHDEMIGRSRAMQDIRETIDRVSPTDARVLIVGENGSGKELVARAIHAKSRRVGEAFVEVNCAAIPEELIESELFGHVKGSFTGAIANRVGKFEQADRGTLFLDEIGDMSLAAQAKVLRVLQEGRLEKVGGNETRVVDVRVIAATNKDLLAEAREARFREDLYYRLNVVPIRVPPLRERRDDIPLLVEYFLQRLSENAGQRAKTTTPRAMERLVEHPWPGNVRELRNLVERMIIMARHDRIEPGELPLDPVGPRDTTDDDLFQHRTFQDFKDDAERRFLERKLAENEGNISKTARVLDMQRSNLYKKMEKYNLDRSGEAE